MPGTWPLAAGPSPSGPALGCEGGGWEEETEEGKEEEKGEA